MKFDERRHVLIVYFTEDRIFSEPLVKQLGDELCKLVPKVPDGKSLVLDFTAVRWVSQELIGVLVVFNKNCQAAKVDLRFRNIRPAVMKALGISKRGNAYEISGGTGGD